MCVWFDQNFMIHEVHVSLTLTIASTQNLRNIVSIESYLELNTMTYALVLYNEIGLHIPSWKSPWLSENVCEETFKLSNSMKHVHSVDWGCCHLMFKISVDSKKSSMNCDQVKAHVPAFKCYLSTWQSMNSGLIRLWLVNEESFQIENTFHLFSMCKQVNDS